MRPSEAWRRGFARADVRMVWIIGAIVTLSFSLSGLAFYRHSAVESLEEADRWFDFVIRSTGRQIEEAGAETDATRLQITFPDAGTALRVRGATGRVVFEQGSWPPPRHQVAAPPPYGAAPERSFAAALRIARHDYLVGSEKLPSGRSVELALPLAHFRSELDEVRRTLVGGGLICVAASLVIGLAASLRAFRPLRRATALLDRIDARSLGQRLPTRGTGDPIDVHAETFNRVLEGIDGAFNRLRDFSSDVAHELRTPLNRITNVSEVALLEGTNQDLRNALESVRDTAEQLARVVHSLLLIAEIDDRRFSLSTTPIRVKSWIELTMSAYAAPFEEAGVKLVSRCEDETIDGDRTLLDRVLANLLDNALAHAPAGSCVEIGAVRRGSRVVISVEDEGPGIPPDERERVFDRFARLGGASKRPGHGLGLALAQAIVRLHDGELRVADSARGGARFEAEFPAHVPGRG